jgi:two-component system, OmpR family, sensor histidine kinase KdpD
VTASLRAGRDMGVRPQAPVAVAASAVSVVLVTVVIGLLHGVVPVLSLGVLYLFAVLPIAATFGLGYAIAVSVASMVAFNFFFLKPIHTLTLADSGNWLALATFVCTSIVVSDLAARIRRRATEAEQRAREAALLGEIAAALLGRGAVEGALVHVAQVLGDVLDEPDARLTLGERGEAEGHGRVQLPLVAAGRPVATLSLASRAGVGATVSDRLLPAVASLLALAIDRERLAAGASEAEALRRSDVVKTAVLRAVSHDLRSPLTAVRLASESLADRSLSLTETDRADLAHTIRDEARRLERTVANLLDLSRLQVGAAWPESELWTADVLVEQALAELGERGRDVQVELPDDLPVIVADAGHVRRILVNLLENAVAVSPRGAPVWVRGVATSHAVELHVTDSGPGVAAGEVEVIFEPFRRGSGAGHEGAGLGLAIARGFAEANGGSLRVESRPGGGCFVVALPRAPAGAYP